MCSSKPAVHESLLSTTVVLVWFKLISRCLYYLFSLDHVEDSRPALREVVINEAAVVLMMLIVILMNKVKLHLIYVRNQKLAGFCVRQCFTLCYIVVVWLYIWSCLQAVNCKDGAKVALFLISMTFMVVSSITSLLIARKLYKSANFGYQR